MSTSIETQRDFAPPSLEAFKMHLGNDLLLVGRFSEGRNSTTYQTSDGRLLDVYFGDSDDEDAEPVSLMVGVERLNERKTGYRWYVGKLEEGDWTTQLEELVNGNETPDSGIRGSIWSLIPEARVFKYVLND